MANDQLLVVVLAPRQEDSETGQVLASGVGSFSEAAIADVPPTI